MKSKMGLFNASSNVQRRGNTQESGKAGKAMAVPAQAKTPQWRYKSSDVAALDIGREKRVETALQLAAFNPNHMAS